MTHLRLVVDNPRRESQEATPLQALFTLLAWTAALWLLPLLMFSLG